MNDQSSTQPKQEDISVQNTYEQIAFAQSKVQKYSKRKTKRNARHRRNSQFKRMSR